MTKTHWKKLHNPDYFGAYCLQEGEEITVTIKSVGLEVVMGTGGKKEECTVAHFSERDVKPLILNVINQKTIQKVYGTPYIEDWTNKKITLYHTNEKAFGEMMEVVRVRPKVPNVEKPNFDQKNEGWDKAVEALAKGNTTINAIEKHYTLSDETKEALTDAASNLV
jgi:hypothetical protein